MKRWLVCAAPVVLAAAAVVGVSAAAKPKPPTISRHPDVTAEASGPTGAVVTYRPATVKNAQSVTYSKASGTIFPLGKTTVTITARNSGGSSRSTFAVNVVDTTPPAFGALQDITTRATSASGATVTYGPIGATDGVDSNPSVTCRPASGTVFPAGTSTVNCSARDAAGNTATKSFKITVQANNPPRFPSPAHSETTTTFQYDTYYRLTGATTTITVSEATDPDGDPVSYSWTATNGTISGSGVSATWIRVIQGGQPARGSVTATASDGHGGSATFTINFT